MPRLRYEATIENNVRDEVVRWARISRIPALFLKLNVTGQRGWPDRVLLWKGNDRGHVLFIEFKRPGEEPRPMQELIHNMIRAAGFDVEVFDDEFTAMENIKARILATTRTSKGDETHSGG